MADLEELPVYYEDLARIEEEFEEIDLQIRKLSHPYATSPSS